MMTCLTVSTLLTMKAPAAKAAITKSTSKQDGPPRGRLGGVRLISTVSVSGPQSFQRFQTLIAKTPKKPTKKAGSGAGHNSIGPEGRQYRLHGSYV
jgi:hypothetical protein